MNRFFVIFNPAARAERSRRAKKFLEAKASSNPNVTLAPTQHTGDATELATRAVADGANIIVAAGGDGTINEVANGIGLSGIPLAVLPLGTVNVFARELGIPIDLNSAWTLAENGRVRTIDLARAEANGKQRYFVQLAGVGFDAWAVRQASWELKKRIGPLSYVWAGLKAVAQPLGDVGVSTNGAHPRGCGPAVLIGNGRFYGGRFALFPRARMDDGLLDVCVFGRGGYLDVIRYGQGVLRGVHTTLPDVCYFQAEEFACSAVAGTSVPFELDGEDAGDAPVRFSVVPRSLRVMTPN